MKGLKQEILILLWGSQSLHRCARGGGGGGSGSGDGGGGVGFRITRKGVPKINKKSSHRRSLAQP